MQARLSRNLRETIMCIVQSCLQDKCVTHGTFSPEFDICRLPKRSERLLQCPAEKLKSRYCVNEKVASKIVQSVHSYNRANYVIYIAALRNFISCATQL